MSNALTPAAPSATPALVPERFANPLKQINGLLVQPAVRRALPMILMVGLVAAAGAAWLLLSTPTQRTLFQNLSDADKATVTGALTTAGIPSHVDDATGAVTVDEDKYSKARMLLASQGLPKATPGGYQILDALPMGVSRAVEGERLRQARETEMARSIEEIDAVAEARVHLAMPENSVFVRDNAAPSASVMVKLNAGRQLDEAQVRSIVNLVASSVPGMKPEAVTIVDQMGSLLSKSSDGHETSASDQRIEFQRHIEDKYRQQLNQLLTPLVGAGNFSAEVQADVDLSETQATRESYDKQGTLRAEQGQWSANKDAQAPGGIPGALSNTPPPPSTATPPTPTPTATPAAGSGVTTPGAAPGATPGQMPDAQKQSDSYTRNYDLGREISVTKGTPGAIKRLSVAVLLRDPETGKPRSPVEIQQITQLVRTAVGSDNSRGDQVTVISRKFAGADAMDSKTHWYDNPWIPIAARNGTAILIALLVLLLGVRPLAKSLIKKREAALPEAAAQPGVPLTGLGAAIAANGQPIEEGEAGAPPPPPPAPAVTIESLESARGFDERVGVVRGFTRDNPARAALAVRDMIRQEAE